MTLVTFSLKDVHYSLDVSHVEEVIPLPEITPLAKLPSFFCGMINLRGCALPIIDLRKRLGIEAEAYELSNDIIVIKYHDKTIGLIVDKVLSVVDVLEKDIMSSPTVTEGVDIQYISGVFQLETSLITLINLEMILNISEDVLTNFNLHLSGV